MRVLEIPVNGMVSREVIPKQKNLAAETMMEIGQIKHEVLETCRAFEDRKIKFEQMTTWRSDDETDACMVVTPRRFAKNRRLTDRRPSAAAIRDERKTGFVLKNKGQTLVVRFFLIRGQT